MKRFAFMSIVLFVAFAAIPAMAIVEIAVTGEYTVDNPATTDINERQIIVTLTYNVIPDPKPTADNITLTPASATFSEGNDPRTYVITYSELGVTESGQFTLTGYESVTAEGELDPDSNPIVNFEDSLTDDDKLIHDRDFLPGLGYAIVSANNTPIGTGVLPTLPTINPPNDIIKVQWTAVSDIATMPDLYGLFETGGSLNLRVNEPGTTNRLGSKKADDTYDDNHGRNQRQVVINEVMWAHDETFIGNATEIVKEQWIELYNRGTTPIAFANMKFTTSDDFPGPDPETDLLSNIPSFDLTWTIDSKGQHGSSETPRREFRSMQRVDYDNGWEPDHWSISTISFLRNYRGTPGKQNRAATVPPPRKRPSKDTPAKNKIIINEIGNFADDESDWIELRNVTGSAQSLNNWVLTKTTGFENEEEIIRFPNKSIPARGVLLLVNGNPTRTPLSAGFDITMDADDQEFGAGPHQYLIVDENKLAIPDDDAWLLILRSNKPWDVGEGRDVYQTGHRVEDVSGPGALHDSFVAQYLRSIQPNYEKKADGKPEGDIWETKVFPLNGNTQADADFLQNDRLNTAGKVWGRDGDKQGYLKDAWKQVGFTGIGYDRRVPSDEQYGGTPGYDNNVAKGKISQLDGGKLIVSELMITTGGKERFPQWIELYNTSKTRAIDLAADSSDPKTGWQLIVENHDSGSWKEFNRNVNITIDLKDLFSYIPPNQTVLIVASKRDFSERRFYPDSRVASIFEKQGTRSEFSMANRKDLILNAEGGFYIKIVDGDGTVSDEIGNLDGNPPNPRLDIGLDDPYSWNWPTALTEDGHRTSLIRLRDANGRPRIGVPNRNVEGDITGAVLPIGTKKARPPKYAWVHAVDTTFKRVPRKNLWYGDSSDIGTPGFIRGTQLPVSLSFFRPTLEDGKVVIRWTTESELDNAGFNILRSDSRNGEFKQVNDKLIQGKGTTAERSTYKWVDTSAKPGAVYYYQIEDVSFAGERTTLTTTKLKGLISAKNKLTTTWSELKSQN